MLPVSLVVLHLKESLGDFAPSEDIGNDYVLLVIKKMEKEYCWYPEVDARGGAKYSSI